MAEVKRMTQTAIVRELAETTSVNNKVAKQFMESLAELAIRETKRTACSSCRELAGWSGQTGRR